MARARMVAVLNAAIRIAWVMGLVIAGTETSADTSGTSALYYVRRLRPGRLGCPWSVGWVGVISDVAPVTSGPSLALKFDFQWDASSTLQTTVRKVPTAPRASVQVRDIRRSASCQCARETRFACLT